MTFIFRTTGSSLLERKVVCLYQMGKKEKVVLGRNVGVGDCSECVTDDGNIYCQQYCPVTVYYFEVNNNGSG